MDESIQMRRLNDYVVYLKQENETLSEELSHLRLLNDNHTEDMEATTDKFLGFIEEQTATVQNHASEIKDLRAANSRLIADNQETMSEVTVLSTLLAQKQAVIDTLNVQKAKKKREKKEKVTQLMDELEQDKVILQLSVRQQLSEIQHLRTQVHNLEYTVKTLKGKINLNSDMNKSLNSLNCNKTNALEATHLLRISKGSGFKKKPRFRSTFDKGQVVAKTAMEIDEDVKSESEDCKLSVISVCRKEIEDKQAQLFTDDEYLEPKDYLQSLDFRNFPIWEHNDERLETSAGRSNAPKPVNQKLSEMYMAPLYILGFEHTERVSIGVDTTDIGDHSIFTDVSKTCLKETGTATDPPPIRKRRWAVSLLAMVALIILVFAATKNTNLTN